VLKSSLSGDTAARLAAAYTEATGRQWSQPLGYIHALFEVASDVLKRSADPTNPEAGRSTSALALTAAANYTSVVGQTPSRGSKPATVLSYVVMPVQTSDQQPAAPFLECLGECSFGCFVAGTFTRNDGDRTNPSR
jgi:hypothetical protein